MNEKYEIVKFRNEEFELDVSIDTNNETVWMTQEEIGILFGKRRSTIAEHISNIYIKTMN